MMAPTGAPAGADGYVAPSAFAAPAVLGAGPLLTDENRRLAELLDWAESLGDCLMQGYVGEE